MYLPKIDIFLNRLLRGYYTFNLSGQSLFIQLYMFIILIFYLLLLPYRLPNPINFYLECLFWFLLGELGWKYQERENHGCQCFLIPTVNMPDLLIRVISFSLLVRSFIYNILFWETTPFFFPDTWHRVDNLDVWKIKRDGLLRKCYHPFDSNKRNTFPTDTIIINFCSHHGLLFIFLAGNTPIRVSSVLYCGNIKLQNKTNTNMTQNFLFENIILWKKDL